MNPRLALLSAILANPDDDLPRLVFADWMEENGTSDADAARVEFIRLGCKGKAKSRMSTAEVKWLDANWQRLLGNTLAARPKGASLPMLTRVGRSTLFRFVWKGFREVRTAQMECEYVRGFARRVEFFQTPAHEFFWQAIATDEPLAYHRPKRRTRVEGNHMVGWWSRLLPTYWGNEVFARSPCPDVGAYPHVKLYYSIPVIKDLSAFHPDAIKDESGLRCDRILRAAVATAMTAIAREYVGLDPAL